MYLFFNLYFSGKSGNGIQEDVNSAGTIGSRATVISAKTLRKRRIAGIFQHYYPEGGWGYVILLCGFLVQMFTHGLQLSFGMFLPIICHRFRISNPADTGKKILCITFSMNLRYLVSLYVVSHYNFGKLLECISHDEEIASNVRLLVSYTNN